MFSLTISFMKKVFYVVLFLVSVGMCFGSYKYEVLFSSSRGIFFSTDYFSESVVSEIFYKHNDFLAFGIGFNGIFNVPIYGYSGVFEETLYFGNFSGYVSFANLVFNRVRVGGLTGLSYRYLLDYREFLVFFDFYSKGSWDNLEYFGIIRKINFGFYFTRFVPIRVALLPWEFDFKVGYSMGMYKFYVGVMGDFDVEYFRFIPALSLSFEYNILDNFKLGIQNTFRNGNALNLELFSQVKFNKESSIRGYFGYSYITGFIGGVGMFIQI